MYPEAFINWIGDNGYRRHDGIWYAWPDYEKMEVPIAESTEELYQIYVVEKQLLD